MNLVLSCLVDRYVVVFFFKQKTAYDMRISGWSSDVCSSDLQRLERRTRLARRLHRIDADTMRMRVIGARVGAHAIAVEIDDQHRALPRTVACQIAQAFTQKRFGRCLQRHIETRLHAHAAGRSEEHTSELQSLMLISIAVL